MKYDTNRHYLYPVMRPHSDDYPKGDFSTLLNTQYSSHNVEVSIEYTVSDDTINEYVRSSQARCVAMLYCRDTMYRQLLQQNIGEDKFRLSEKIPMRLLQNQVEVHPAIVAHTRIKNFSTATAHDEYSDQHIRIEKGQPLAVDDPWHFEVNSQQLKVDSLFKLAVDEQGELKDYEFDVTINEKERYVDIKANEDTIDSFRKLRKIKNATIPTIYLSSLITLLSRFQEINAYSDLSFEDIPSVGWYRCLHKKLEDYNIVLDEPDNGSKHSIMRAAQQLLTSDSSLRPYGRLFQLGLIDDTE